MNMTILIRRLCTITLVATASNLAFAQQSTTEQPTEPPTQQWKQHTPEERIEHRVEMMRKRLAISDEQATKIAAVLRSEQHVLAEDRERMHAAPADQKILARTQMQQDRLNVKSKVLQNLTPEQLAKAEALRRQREAIRHRSKMDRYEHRKDRN